MGRNVFLLFQPAEETGAGAAPCCELFEKESVAEIYGAHNLPGFPEGEIYTRPGTFACASRGVTLRFQGAPTHAAYPENGKNPALGRRKASLRAAGAGKPCAFCGHDALHRHWRGARRKSVRRGMRTGGGLADAAGRT